MKKDNDNRGTTTMLRNRAQVTIDDDATLTEDAPITSEDENVVRRELERMREFVGGLSMEDLRQGDWFVKLLKFALDGYTDQVDAAYFRAKYPDLPPDAIVQARIQMAANYAAIEGGLSALAYNGAIAATIGSGGGASPLTLPAGGAAFVIDTSYTSYLQLRMAYDISVLYRIPLNLNDPDDMWKLVKIAMGIKAGEAGTGALVKGAPAVVRPVLKKIFSGSTLTAAKGLPVVGKHLLQRNIIKIGLPVVGVPLTVVVNRWTTKVVGTQAAKTLRTEARIREAAARLAASTPHHEELAWVLWLIIRADGKITESQRLLLHHVTSAAVAAGADPAMFDELRAVIEIDVPTVLAKIDALEEGRAVLYDAAVLAATVDGDTVTPELDTLERLAAHCGLPYDSKAVKDKARGWR